LAGLERWKLKYPEVAKLLAVDDVLVDSMRGRSSTWTRIRVNLRHVAEDQRPAQETPDPDDDPTREWRNGVTSRRPRSPRVWRRAGDGAGRRRLDAHRGVMVRNRPAAGRRRPSPYEPRGLTLHVHERKPNARFRDSRLALRANAAPRRRG